MVYHCPPHYYSLGCFFVHQHNELSQVQLAIVVHVHLGHHAVHLSMRRIPPQSPHDWSKLPGADEATLILQQLVKYQVL